MIQDIVLLVPDSCRATVRNGNSISTDFKEDTIKNNFFLLFLLNMAVVSGLFISSNGQCSII